MKKPIIAIDIDDVLARSAEEFAAYSNERWQSGITADDYCEEWALVWKISVEEAIERAHEFHEANIVGEYRHFESALPVLAELKDRFELVVVTSRRLSLKPETDVWLDTHFKDIFSAVHYAGMWDSDMELLHKINATKTDVCQNIGAQYLIDDQLKHCVHAAQAGLKAVLFGNYAWNGMNDVPNGIVRVASWPEVGEYFNEQ